MSVDPRFSIEQTAGCEHMWQLIIITYFVYWYASAVFFHQCYTPFLCMIVYLVMKYTNTEFF